MTWSISISAGSKEEAKRQVAQNLPAAMLHQKPHNRDFTAVMAGLCGAIDALDEGSISGSAYGHLSGTWASDGTMQPVTGISITINLNSSAT